MATIKLAKFKSLDHGYECYEKEHFDSIKGYLRLTEYAEVELTPRIDTEVINDEVSKLDEVIKQIKNEALAKIESINTRKAELLALTHG